MPTDNELRYYEALKRITRYATVDQLRRGSEKDYGLPFEEALEYAYENIKNEAEAAIKGKRRPRLAPKQSKATGADEPRP